MEVRELICIGCPLGCPLTVQMDQDKVTVTRNTCRRGEDYGRKEVMNPTRIITSSVRVKNGRLAVVSVKTSRDIPKDKMFQCMEEIHQASLEAPVAMGDVVIADCAGTGVPVIATRTVERKTDC